jgi:hypothetical protein
MPLAGLVRYNWSRSVGFKTLRWKVETEADPAASMRKEFVRLKQVSGRPRLPAQCSRVQRTPLKVRGNRAGCAGFSKGPPRNLATRASSRVIKVPVTQMLMCWRSGISWCRWTDEQRDDMRHFECESQGLPISPTQLEESRERV